MDWSEKVLCIKCNEGGNLFVCSEDGCPLAVHEGCMGCPARFDDAGHYYCPYCFYKQAVAESRKAREYALAKKKALLLFMDQKMMGNEKHIEEDKRTLNNSHNESKYGEANEKNLTCNNGKSKANHDASLDQSMQPDKEQKIGNEEAEKVQKEESEGSSGSKGQDPSPKLHEEQSFSNEVDKKSQEGTQDICDEEENKKQEEEQSIDNSEEERDNILKHYISDSEEEKIQEEISETPSPSSGEDLLHTMLARRTRQPKRKKPVEQDSEVVSARKYPTMKKKTSPTTKPPTKSSRRPRGPNQVVGSPPQRFKTPEKAIVKM